MKTQIVLPFVRETPGTVIYAVSNIKKVAVGQVYVRKEHLEQVDGAWPSRITVTVEPGDTTGDDAR